MWFSLGTKTAGPTVHVADEVASVPPPPRPSCSLPAHLHVFPGAHTGVYVCVCGGGHREEKRKQCKGFRMPQTRTWIPGEAVALRPIKLSLVFWSQLGDQKCPHWGCEGSGAWVKGVARRGPQGTLQVFSFPAPSLPDSKSWGFSSVVHRTCWCLFCFVCF